MLSVWGSLLTIFLICHKIGEAVCERQGNSKFDDKERMEVFVDSHSSAMISPPSTSISDFADDEMSLCSRPGCTRYGACIRCPQFSGCRYGELLPSVNCTVHPKCRHSEGHSIAAEAVRCRFCWQTEAAEQECDPTRNCSSCDHRLRRTICRVRSHVVCRGRRTFYKNVRCRWTSGHSWRKAMLYSVTLGGFGIDRFYLGLWKSGIGKLFSFGGLGVWTMLDIVLIGIGYVQPADGSMYI